VLVRVFCSSLLFAVWLGAWARSQPLDLSPIRGSTLCQLFKNIDGRYISPVLLCRLPSNVNVADNAADWVICFSGTIFDLEGSLLIVCSKCQLHIRIISKENGTTHFKKCKQLFEYNFCFYLETSGGQSSNLYLNVDHFFNTSVYQTYVAA
jgi:hypothetical protein